MTPVSSRKLVLLLVILTILVAMATSSLLGKSVHFRQRRNALQLCQLITIHTNRSCFDYNNYGCYCGVGNADSNPVDEVDRCCKVHDNCFGSVNCYWIYPSFIYYSYQCDQNECSCSEGQFFSTCTYATCQCDLEFARCLEDTVYNINYSYYSRQLCTAPDPLERTETTTNL